MLQLPVRSKPRANSAEDELRARVSCIAVRWRCRAAAASIAGSSISENAGRPVPISLQAAQCSSATCGAGEEGGRASSVRVEVRGGEKSRRQGV